MKSDHIIVNDNIDEKAIFKITVNMTYNDGEISFLKSASGGAYYVHL